MAPYSHWHTMALQQALVVLIVLCQILDLVTAQTSTISSAIAGSALSSSLSSECVSFISEYPPTISQYASQVCQVCQNLQLTPSVEPCCSNSNPTACFASSFYGITVPDATRSAPITTSAADPGSTNCDAVISILEVCEAATPGFDNLCFHDQQSCFCSTSGTWAPSYYDNFWSGCLAWASTAVPESYSLIAGTPVRSRKCETYAALTATGGTPSDCMTSPSNTLSSTSLASTGASGLSTVSSSAFAAEIRRPEHQDLIVILVIHLITVCVVG